MRLNTIDAQAPQPYLKVHLIGDLVDVRKRLTELERCGRLRVVGVSPTSRQALADIRQTRPHLVLLHLQSMGREGLQVLRGLAESDAVWMIYVLSTTGDEWIREACTNAGATHLFDMSQGLRSLHDAISSLASSI